MLVFKWKNNNKRQTKMSNDTNATTTTLRETYIENWIWPLIFNSDLDMQWWIQNFENGGILLVEARLKHSPTPPQHLISKTSKRGQSRSLFRSWPILGYYGKYFKINTSWFQKGRGHCLLHTFTHVKFRWGFSSDGQVKAGTRCYLASFTIWHWIVTLIFINLYHRSEMWHTV